MHHFIRFLTVVLALLVLGCDSANDFVVVNGNNVDNANGGAGVPAQLAFVTNPAQTTNTEFSVAPVVEVQDSFGNRVPGDTTQVSVSLVNPGTAVLNGTSTRNAVDGRATFTGLSVSEAGTFTLQASAAGLSSGNSANFVVSPRLALYGIASGAGQAEPERLIEIDPSNGQLLGVLGDIGDRSNFAFFKDLECLPDGTMLATANDVATGNIIFLVNVNPAAPENSTVIGTILNGTTYNRSFGLAYDSVNQVLYTLLRRNDGEYIVATVDIATGTPTPLPNPTGENGNGGNGLAFDESTGTLYRTRSQNLYTIDTTTGIGTLVSTGGGVTFDGSGPRGLDFHPTAGTLYAASRGTSGVTGTLARVGTIDTATGVSSVLGSGVGISGLSFCENPTATNPGLPRQTGYTVEPITQALVDISASGMPHALDDDDSASVPIGFTFNFNGTNYTDLRVSSNGFVTFDTTSSDVSGTAYLLPGIDLATDPNTLCLWFDDLNPGQGGEIYTETLGTAPNRTLVIHYAQVEHETNVGNGIEAEIILYEGTNIIEYHYSDVLFGDPDVDLGQAAVVGIQIDDTTADLWSALNPVLTDTTAIRFTPPSP